MEIFKKYTQMGGTSISIKGDEREDFIVIEITNKENSSIIKISAQVAFSLSEEIRSIANRANMYRGQYSADHPI